MRKLILLSTFIFLIFSGLYSAFNDANYGLRSSGMGSAFTAVADDVSALIYNPAGVSFSRRQLGFMYYQPFLGLENVNFSYSQVGLILPVSRRLTLAGGYLNYNASDMYQEGQTIFTAGFKLKKNLSFGLNYKYLEHRYIVADDIRTEISAAGEDIFDKSLASGSPALDFGIFLPGEKLNFGLLVKNLNTKDVGLKYEDKIAQEYRLGLAYKIGDVGKFLEDILIASDFSWRNTDWGTANDKLNLALGAECWLSYHRFAFRAGADLSSISFGLGFGQFWSENSSLTIDYSFVLPVAINCGLGNHKIATTLRF